MRLRRLTAAAEAIALGDFESPLRYRFRDEFGTLALSFDRMRRQLRRSFRHIEGERDRLRMLLERLHEGVVTVDDELVVHFVNAEARRVLGVRLAEGDPLPEPWELLAARVRGRAVRRPTRRSRRRTCTPTTSMRWRSSASRRSPRATRC